MRVLGGLLLGLLVAAGFLWLGNGEGTAVSAPQPARADSAALIASAASGQMLPAASNDPWALLNRAEVSGGDDSQALPIEVQKALAWLDPAKDSAWCALRATQAAAPANEEHSEELSLTLAMHQTLLRWAHLLQQRGDLRSLAAADYLEAMALQMSEQRWALGPLQGRALNSQDGRVLALATQLSCEPVQARCQDLVTRWLLLEPRNELALGWQFNLLPPDSPRRLEALARLAEAQADTESQRFWAEFFQSLPRTASEGLRRVAEQSALESLFWAGSGPQVASWAMVCRRDKRPATVSACVKLAERVWQSERANLLEKSLAVLIGKSQAGAGSDWAQREQTVKAVQAAGSRMHEEAVGTGPITCKQLAARHDRMQELLRDGEWRVFSRLASQTTPLTQPVLRSPAAIPLIDK
ncbi:hypothetical protein [Roseateles oligotrophus]|uniref:DUF4034 domain-containing protein n=1 Tax=Roseateles oligotrophus TaxID=1769250 RepID=A0ABT2YH84_9BURK|nr:hypothetical protein [Roseateles oligotrophus]MCV2369412.1 hypothetical protein [Roseateles oligotrophus]